MRRKRSSRRRHRGSQKLAHRFRGFDRLEPRLLLGGAVFVENVILWNLDDTLLGWSHAASYGSEMGVHLFDTWTPPVPNDLPAESIPSQVTFASSLNNPPTDNVDTNDPLVAVAGADHPSTGPNQLAIDQLMANEPVRATTPNGVGASAHTNVRSDRNLTARLLRTDVAASTAPADFQATTVAAAAAAAAAGHDRAGPPAMSSSQVPDRFSQDPAFPPAISPVPSTVLHADTAARPTLRDDNHSGMDLPQNLVTGGDVDFVTTSSAVLEAEDATHSGAVPASGHTGYTGTGFLDFINPVGDNVEWIVDVTEAGSHELSFRYALQKGNRPLELTINGVTQVTNLGFPATGSWESWSTVTHDAQLNVGQNSVRLTAIGSSGANIDHLQVGNALSISISDAAATEGTDPFLVFDVGLNQAALEPITLDLLAADLSARGGFSGNFGEDPTGNPVDYANQEIEVSFDGGANWQPANSGTEVSFAIGQSDLKVRAAVNDDLAFEGNNPETMSLSVASVLAGVVDDFSDTGIGAISDNELIGGGLGGELEAEEAFFAGPSVASNHAGYTGTGFLDFINPTGDFVEWTVDSPQTLAADLSFRYALSSGNRPLELAINGVTVDPSLDFLATGGWENWANVSYLAPLTAGQNTVRLTAIGSSGPNVDHLQVGDSIAAIISDANAQEGTDDYLIFDIDLTRVPDELVTLDLFATDVTAKGGLIGDFTLDPSGDPVDYANQEFEFSTDGGSNWQPANNGTEVSFPTGTSDVDVRLAINDDLADEATETMRLGVSAVLAGTVDDVSDTGLGMILDDDDPPSVACSPISLLTCTEVRVEGDLVLDFDGTDGGLADQLGRGTGFTMADPASNPGNPNPQEGVVGYWPEKLDVDPTNEVLRISATPGIQYAANNNLDNALGVGLNLPSQTIRMRTTLTDIPVPAGGYSQAGLWFGKAEGGGAGNSEDNYIKFVLISPPSGGYLLEALQERDGAISDSVMVNITDTPAHVALELLLDPANDRVVAEYEVDGGLKSQLVVFEDVPEEWFSKDQAGINPTIATRSFGGVFATSRLAAPQVFSFDDFSVVEDIPTVVPTSLSFDRWSIPVGLSTSMEMGPDGRLYVATLFGTVHAITIDTANRTFQDEVISTIPDTEGGGRLTLGLAVDPDSTAEDVVLWVAHSNGSVNSGELNSGKVSRLSGPGFTQKDDVIMGLPRAIANHGTNDIDFGPDGRLYLWQGGNTGAGSANNVPSEFGNRPEQVLSAALLVADVKDPTFNGQAGSHIGEFVEEFYSRTDSDVLVYASGLRNTYDGIFHSNGNIYAPDNGLGVTGTVPPVPRLGDPTDRSITTLLGEVPVDNPGPQIDPLNLIFEGGYFGHPNPYRDEVVFKDGTFQGFDDFDADPTNDIPPGHPPYQQPLANLGANRSANGIIEYTDDNFFGQLQGDLLIANFSQGDDITRAQLSPDGATVISQSSLTGGFIDPLPLVMGPDGVVIVGEFNSGITVLEPLGTWRTDLPTAPEAVLDAGSAAVEDRLYMVGGKTGNSHVSSLYIYDPGDPLDGQDDSWTTGPDLPGVAVENPAAVEYDGQLYVFGGSTQPFSGAVDNAAFFDPISSTWTTLPNMPTARGGATAQVLDDKIYVIGGLAANGGSLDLVEVFDPATGQWSPGSSMQIRRDNPGSAVIGGQLYAFGGRTRNAGGGTVDPTLTSLEIYNPGTGQWSFGAAMPTGRRVAQVGTLNDRIQVVGGEAGPGGTTFEQHEEYDPQTDTWRLLPSAETARHGAAFATIGDVLYVVAGGPTAGSSFTDTVEAFTF